MEVTLPTRKQKFKLFRFDGEYSMYDPAIKLMVSIVLGRPCIAGGRVRPCISKRDKTVFLKSNKYLFLHYIPFLLIL
jgi:hypothetical protein